MKKVNKNSDAIPCGWRHYTSGIVTVSRWDSVTIFKYVFYQFLFTVR